MTTMDGKSCPACRGGLTAAPIDARVLACMSCGGVWMDREAFEKVAAAAGLSEPPPDKMGVQPASDAANRCPDCSGDLARTTRSGIALDVCKADGVWLDRGELQRLAARKRGEDGERKTSPPPPLAGAGQGEDLKKTIATGAALEGALDVIRLFF